MSELPAHVSPDLPAQAASIALLHAQTIPDLELGDFDDLQRYHSHPPPTLVSPSFTPPATPGTGTPALQRDAEAFAVDSTQDTHTTAPPKLLDVLPQVDCLVRARIPTTAGTEMFLHLYQNSLDNKEHLAIVFGSSIRSRSLDAPRPGETEMDRMIRGAYTGRLYPGRQSSRVDAPHQKSTSVAATASPPASKSQLPKPAASNTLIPPSQTPSAASIARHTAAAPAPSQSSSVDPESETIPLYRPPTITHETPLVRIHSECYTGETVWSARCDCGEQLDEAARLMSLPNNRNCGGVIVYLRQEGRGIGLGEKLKAYNLQDLGSDTVEANLLLRHPADARSYGLATAILCDLGLGGEQGIRLLTNNPDKIRAVEGPNREVVVKERVAMIPLAWSKGGAAGINSEEVGKYLRTKIERMGHMLQQS